jgi:hypothetical protein
LEGSWSDAISDCPGVVCSNASDCEPTPENDDVEDEADDEDIKDSNITVRDVAWQDPRGSSDAIEDDDEIERVCIGHVENISSERGKLVGIS